MELNAKTIMNRLQKETELLKPITPENSKKLKSVLVNALLMSLFIIKINKFVLGFQIFHFVQNDMNEGFSVFLQTSRMLPQCG